MLEGEKCLLTCKPEYAYGDRGAGDKIPAGATLEFEVRPRVARLSLLPFPPPEPLELTPISLFHQVELLHWKSVRELTDDGGVIKKAVQEGTGWENPKDVDEVTGAPLIIFHRQTIASLRKPSLCAVALPAQRRS